MIQAFHNQIWLCCREMIQARVSGSWHTLLTQLLLTSLLPHSISVKDRRLECASVIRWCRWTQVVSVKLNIKECVMNRMISKRLPNVCIRVCGEGFLPVYPALGFTWRGDYFSKTLLFWLISLFGLNMGVEGRGGTSCKKRKSVSS